MPGEPALVEIDYGRRLRAGVLVPSGNSVAEPEIRAMLPAGVSALVTRLPLRGSSRAELMTMLDGLEAAARLLADAQVDVIVFHCTAVSTFAPDLAGTIRDRIQAATGLPCFTTADAIIAALQRLQARRVTLLTPYIGEVHQREADFLVAGGFEVADSAWLGIDTNTEMGRCEPATLLDWAQREAATPADACLISCTAIKSLPIVAELERRIAMPVLTSNQCMVWYLLDQHGIAPNDRRFGRLFEVPHVAAEAAGA
ncbi:maleate cis-trans isomerase family protein [Rhodopseudomonas palustris]|uniref:Arylmalonate decarboxylase n=1 Tax=Rhodopseudomonas palustris TaxID=1076 RepID=A0A418UXI1_RHOPL|nr:aspartate/glutamate racemase family protein [Rhodopseudomonas palustris]RJF64968.1 hypothetical protein D4Q52_25045 [Rhodopseudomonas palustris]